MPAFVYRKILRAEIDKNKARISTSMQMTLDGEIESFDYKEIESKFEVSNTTLLQERASLKMDNEVLSFIMLESNGFKYKRETEKKVFSLRPGGEPAGIARLRGAMRANPSLAPT